MITQGKNISYNDCIEKIKNFTSIDELEGFIEFSNSVYEITLNNSNLIERHINPTYIGDCMNMKGFTKICYDIGTTHYKTKTFYYKNENIIKIESEVETFFFDRSDEWNKKHAELSELEY